MESRHLRGNKGEWSEVYAFLRLLADGEVYSGDKDLNKIPERTYPLLALFRDDKPGRTEYRIRALEGAIEVLTGEHRTLIPQAVFSSKANELLNQIKLLKSAGEIPILTPFFEAIHCNVLKAKSKDKADVRLVVHHLKTGTQAEMGYSIKSKLGGASTLINANKDGTNFLYELVGISEQTMKKWNQCKYFRDRFALLDQSQVQMVALGPVDQILKTNLLMLDLGLEQILSNLLLAYYMEGIRDISSIAQKLTEQDPLQIVHGETPQPMYEYKIKQWLLAFALGMTCNHPWNGQFNAKGGYVVVREDGEVVCYHFFDRNDLEDYLFYNTCLDTPSTGRHDFGQLYHQDNRYYLKLNLQVRFK